MLDCHLMQKLKIYNLTKFEFMPFDKCVCTTQQIGNATKKKQQKKKTVKREIRLSFMGPLCACTVDDKQKESGKTRPVCIIFASFSTKEELSGMRFHDLIIIKGTRYHDTLILLFDTHQGHVLKKYTIWLYSSCCCKLIILKKTPQNFKGTCD